MQTNRAEQMGGGGPLLSISCLLSLAMVVPAPQSTNLLLDFSSKLLTFWQLVSSEGTKDVLTNTLGILYGKIFR